MRKVVLELTSIDTTIAIDQSSFALLLVPSKLTHIGLSIDFVDQVSVPFLVSGLPLTLVVLLITIKHPVAMFLVSQPLSIVIGPSFIVVIDSLALLGASAEMPIVNLATVESIDSLTMKDSVPPTSKVDIAYRILQKPFTMPRAHFVELSHIGTLVRLNLLSIR
jgi:hypothetical protein